MKNMKENKQGNGQSRSISGSRTPLGYIQNKHQKNALDNPTHSFKISQIKSKVTLKFSKYFILRFIILCISLYIFQASINHRIINIILKDCLIRLRLINLSI